MKRIGVNILLALVKSLIKIKELFVTATQATARALWRYAKRFAKHPVVAIYRTFVLAQAQLNKFGVRIRNPWLYAFQAKTSWYVLMIITGSTLIFLNYALNDHEDTVLYPNTIIARATMSEDDRLFLESSSGTNANQGSSNIAGVSAQRSVDQGLSEAPATSPALGDIAQNTGALIKPVIPNPSVNATISPTQRNDIRTYVVEAGDTVGGIARKFGLRTNTVLWANSLTLKSSLRMGQQLTILPTDGVTYKVKRGDTIGKIAHDFSTDVNKIIASNNLEERGLRIGATIIVPGGSPQPSAVAIAKPSIVSRIRDIILPSNVEKPLVETLHGVANFIWPTQANRLTQYFSWRHTGVDIAGPVGLKIFAAADGIVSIAGWQNGYGNTILLSHGNGVQTRYGHASKLLVSPGDYVQQGQTIALVGSTGHSTGPHLHFEIVLNGKRVNPLGYIR